MDQKVWPWSECSGKVPAPEVKVMDLVDTFSTMVSKGHNLSMSSIDARVEKNLYPIQLESWMESIKSMNRNNQVYYLMMVMSVE